MSPAWSGCADAALERHDPLVATAPPCAGWLLIEHPGPWPRDAFAGSGIDADVRRSLAAAAASAGYRILLIRRPGRQDRDAVTEGRHWAVVAAGTPGSATWGRWFHDRALLDVVPLLARAARGPDTPGRASVTGPATGEPLLLVCAHGLHDTCCAVRGRPVAAALQTRWPTGVWECSHLGGDRFAPNLVVLPDGTHYGRLTPESAVALVSAHLADTLQLDQWRGISTMPPPAQAAAAALHRASGPWGAADVRVLTVRSSGARGPWQVELDSPVGRRRAQVAGRPRPPAALTCRATLATSALEYVVTWLDPFSTEPV